MSNFKVWSSALATGQAQRLNPLNYHAVILKVITENNSLT
jgi:hypothetical protein